MRYKPPSESWLEFITRELADDPDCHGVYKSAAAAEVAWLYHHIESLQQHIASQSAEIRRMERRNLKLSQRITRLQRRLKGLPL